MKILIVAVLSLFISQWGMSQTELIIFESNAEFKGRISVTADTNSVFIGDGAGSSIMEEFSSMNTFVGTSSGRDNTKGANNSFFGGFSGLSNTTGFGNVMVGFQSGQFNTTGIYNAFLGHNAGFSNASGNNNAYFGNSAGLKNTTGNQNTFIGAFAGFENLTGTGNVFIGHQAGQLDLGSNKLYIANSSTTTPLIYGEFDAPKVELNAAVHISEFLKLTPSTAPSAPEKGTIYYDINEDKLKVWTGNVWENLH